MKQNNDSTGIKEVNCDPVFCVSCKTCKTVNEKKARPEPESDELQLYSKEAEHYFFYYRVWEADVKPGI